MLELLILFVPLAFSQPQRCDNLTEAIANNSQYGKDGVFNTSYYPDAFKDLVSLHIPTVTLDGNRGTAVMTSHPQTADHYITDIWVFDERERMVHCRKFSSTERAEERFEVPERVGNLVVFEHCNLHGVWMTTVEVRCSDLRRLIEDNMRLYNTSGIYNNTHYPSAFADLVDLHIPKVVVSDDKTSGEVTLSSHPMVEAHHITDIWVLDQHGRQIACDRLVAGDKAMLSFNIPSNTTTLHVIEHCNLHGVWQADPVEV